MKEKETLIRSFYECPNCETLWEGVWDCACDDECPECHAGDISPYEYREENYYIENKNSWPSLLKRVGFGGLSA